MENAPVERGEISRINEFMGEHPRIAGVAAGVLGMAATIGAVKFMDNEVAPASAAPVMERSFEAPDLAAVEAPAAEQGVRMSMPTVEAEAWPTADKTPETPDATASGAEASAATFSAKKTIGPNALKKLCVKAGLKMPELPEKVLGAGVFGHPGKTNDHQTWVLSERNQLVPAECNGEYKRFMWVRPEVQDPGNHRRWYPAYRPKWQFVMADNRGEGDKNDPNYQKAYPVHASQSLRVDIGQDKRTQIYRCTPGARSTAARVKVRNRVKDLDTGKFVAGKVKKYPVNIVSGKC